MNHYDDGTKLYECSNYEGRVWVCGCGEPFMEHSELLTHVERENAFERAEAAHLDGLSGASVACDEESDLERARR